MELTRKRATMANFILGVGLCKGDFEKSEWLV
jgi:hypothetical protein